MDFFCLYTTLIEFANKNISNVTLENSEGQSLMYFKSVFLTHALHPQFSTADEV